MAACIFILELIGTVAFAVSGAMTALKKKHGHFRRSDSGADYCRRRRRNTRRAPRRYAACNFSRTGIRDRGDRHVHFVFIPSVRHLLTKNLVLYERVMLIMDSLGLGIFTVVGISAAYGISEDFNLFLLLFVGIVTGAGGGVLRDVLAGNTPYIFVKHVYACASGFGALLCALCWEPLGAAAAMLLGAAAVIALRFLAAHFRWSLPRAGRHTD